MKLIAAPVALLFVTLSVLVGASSNDGTITQVVKLLQAMLEKSTADGKEERELYAKFKCYCDTNEAEKTTSIEDLTLLINTLDSEMGEIKGSTGGLSTDVAKLRAEMTKNEENRAMGQGIRDKENAAFLEEEADLDAAIGQMNLAIQTLSDIGSDQTESTGADHSQFMAKDKSLLSTKRSLTKALQAASALMPKEQRVHVDAFLQAPFTGTYSAQSGAVVGIIKTMRDTFDENLATARSTETKNLNAHNKLKKTLEDAHAVMTSSFDDKQATLGLNDGDLAIKLEQHTTAVASKADDEEFLEKLQATCTEKAKDNEHRNALRANEDAAIAEAIAILNSDSAFATFGKSDATSTGATGFLQLSSHRARVSARLKAQALLEQAMAKHRFPRLVHVLKLLQAGNPFESVLSLIREMIVVIDKEGVADQDNLDFCNEERETTTGERDNRVAEMGTLNSDIDGKVTLIGELKGQISDAETSLETNQANQVAETKDRKAENLSYQKDIKHLVEAQSLLTGAVTALKKYYEGTETGIDAPPTALAQIHSEPAPPASSLSGETGSYAGQSSEGNRVIEMLDFILDETKKEEVAAHQTEADSQHGFEDSMKALTGEEADTRESLATLTENLATAKEDLSALTKSLKEATTAKETLEAYLLKIKPGCDFITDNIELRNTNRADEKSALENAISLLENSAAYKNAMAEAHQESMGKCAGTCNDEGEDHAKCMACLAKVTVPGYCAGHPGIPGC